VIDSGEGTIRDQQPVLPSGGPGEPAPAGDDEEVVRVLDQCLCDLERGIPLDTERLLADHPAIAHRLRACLSGLSLLDEATSPKAPWAASAPPEIADHTIVREIGRGGMGIVYEAMQRSQDRRVALKVLPFAAALDPRQRTRFQNEAHAASRLRHPHIVPVYETGSAGGVHFFTMKLIEGVSLATVLAEQRKEGGVWPATAPAGLRSSLLFVRRSSDSEYIGEVARLAQQAAEGLDHAHEVGVIHRDIKPGNLLVDERGQLWITDFGLASIQGGEGLTGTGDFLGTLRYMSPEQASARRGVVDHRTDVYALGVTLYELLTLTPAFSGRDRQEVLTQLALDDPRPPRRLNPAIPIDLETIVLKAMAKAPEERYATARALADDLGRFRAGQPIAARRPGLAALAARWVRRRRGLAAAILLFIVATTATLAVSTGLVWMALQSEQRQRALADAKELESRRHRYAAQMTSAMQEWRDGNVARVLALLEQHRPAPGAEDLRCFEWFHLWHLCQHAQRGVLRGDGRPVRAIAAAPDGSVWASAGDGGTIHLWDPATLQSLGTLRLDAAKVHSLAISSDGQRLAAACGERPAELWDLATRQRLASLGKATEVLFSLDGGTLYSSGGRRLVELWNGRTGARLGLLSGNAGLPNCLAVSGDGSSLALAGNDRRVCLADLTSTEKAFVEVGTHRSYVLCLAFSPDGAALISGSEDGYVQLWDVAGRKAQLEQPLRQHTGAVNAAAWSPDGRHVATGSGDGSIKVWNAQTREVVLQQGHPGPVYCIAFTPDGNSLLTGGEDGGMRVWNLKSRPEPLVLSGHERWVPALSISGDGRWLASSSSDGTARLWRLAGPVADDNAPLQPLVLKPDSQPVPAWMSREGMALGGEPDRVMGVGFTSSSQQVITADFGGRVRLWDAATSNEAGEFEPADGPIWALAISPDGQTLAAAGYTSNVLTVWDIASRKKRTVLRGHTDRVWTVAFSPDGRRIASAANDKAVRMWDAFSGSPQGVVHLPVEFLFALAWSSDGRQIAASGDDCRIRLIDAAAAKELKPIGQHPAAIRGLAFFPDGKTLAAGGDDGAVRLWDLATRQERATLRVRGSSIWSLAVAPDGRQVAAGDGDGEITVWNRADRE